MMNPFKAYAKAQDAAIANATRYNDEAIALMAESEDHKQMTQYVKAFNCRKASKVKLQMATEALSFMNIMFDTIEITIKGEK